MREQIENRGKGYDKVYYGEILPPVQKPKSTPTPLQRLLIEVRLEQKKEQPLVIVQPEKPKADTVCDYVWQSVGEGLAVATEAGVEWYLAYRANKRHQAFARRSR